MHTEIAPTYMSDHAIPYIIFKIAKQVRGPGFCKLNVSLLEEEDYVESTNELLDDILADHDFSSNTIKWEMIKLKARGLSIQYSSRKKKSRNNILNALEAKLVRLEKELVAQDVHDRWKIFSEKNTLEEMEKVKPEISELMEYKTRGAMIRTRRNWIKHGEKSALYFFNLEKYNYVAKNRYKLRGKDGKVETNLKRILQMQKEYYAKLYRTSEIDTDENYLSELQCIKLSEEEKTDLDQNISILEIKDAINELKRQKCPGNDGLCIEWYAKFFDKIKFFLLTLFHKISWYGLPESSKNSPVTG